MTVKRRNPHEEGFSENIDSPHSAFHMVWKLREAGCGQLQAVFIHMKQSQRFSCNSVTVVKHGREYSET